MSSVKPLLSVTAALVMLAFACGDVSVEVAAKAPVTSATTAATPTTAPDPLAEWCRGVAPDFCLWGLFTTFEDPPGRNCLLEATSQPEFISSACNRSDAPPATTIPTGSDSPMEAQITAFRDATEMEARRVLAAAHPDHAFAAALILPRPAPVDAAVALAAALDRPAIGAWMTVPVCIDGYAAIGMGQNPMPTRFAYVDATGEAARRLEVAESGPPITGRFIFDAHLASIELAGAALDAPGVTVDAVLVEAAVVEFASLEAAEAVTRVRLLWGSPEWGLAPTDVSPADVIC